MKNDKNNYTKEKKVGLNEKKVGHKSVPLKDILGLQSFLGVCFFSA
jgi:hypothetical protein